jgi:hypothetical protein
MEDHGEEHHEWGALNTLKSHESLVI